MTNTENTPGIDQRLDSVQDALKSVLANQEQLKKNNSINEILTVEEAADYLRVSKSFVYKLIQHRKVPHFKPDARPKFYRKDLDAYMQSGKVSTIEELEKKATKLVN
jgi:excisionase family DNA binding protein